MRAHGTVGGARGAGKGTPTGPGRAAVLRHDVVRDVLVGTKAHAAPRVAFLLSARVLGVLGEDARYYFRAEAQVGDLGERKGVLLHEHAAPLALTPQAQLVAFIPELHFRPLRRIFEIFEPTHGREHLPAGVRASGCWLSAASGRAPTRVRGGLGQALRRHPLPSFARAESQGVLHRYPTRSV
jgi:hypothetical protein